MAIQYQRGQKLTIRLEKMVAGGVALGRLPDQRLVFVKDGAPGEEAEVALTRIKSNFAEAQFVRTNQPSLDRVEAPFAAAALAGANWHYLAYAAQLQAKEEILAETLEKIGKLTKSPIEPIVASANQWRYRNKVELTFGLDGDRVALGFHKPGSFDQIMPTNDVALFPEISQAIIQAITEWANHEYLTVYEPRRQTGLLRNLVIRRAEHTADLLINLVTSPGSIPVASLLTAVDPVPISGLIWSQNRSAATIVRVDEAEILLGRPTIEEHFVDQPIQYGFDSFFQTHTSMAEQLAEGLLGQLAKLNPSLVIDGYGGVGTFGLLAAAAGASVVSIESHPASSKDAEDNAQRLGQIERMTFINEPMEHFLTTQDLKFQPRDSVLIVDPPRAGLHPKALKAILASKIQDLLYVSCNPATLARDLLLFTSDSLPFTPILIRPFDLFPQTPHLETLVQLRR